MNRGMTMIKHVIWDFDGTLFSCIRKKGFSFHNFTSFIILTEEILDFVGKPQSFQEKRTFNKEKKYLRIENLHIQEDCSYIYEQHGAYATYDIIIMTRRKSDWQGIVKKDEEVIGEFKSILELMHLLVVR